MNTTEIAEKLFSLVTEAVAARRPRPESTYRLQFHAGFTFRDAAAIVPYLHDLGITHCYASPYLKARPGSTHGYDIIDHGALNPEIGTIDDYENWVGVLHEHGMGQILDTVPNHMGVGSNDNPWWNDVLENGPASRYAPFFDIAWRSSLRPELRDKVLLPVLADLYGDVLEDGQLTLSFGDGAFFVNYGDRRFPVAPRSYGRILGPRIEELASVFPADDPCFIEFQSILTSVRNLPGSSETEPERVTERQREKEVIKRRLGTLAAQSEPIRQFIDRNVALFAGTPGDPRSFELMDDLLENQCYRLSYWRVGSDEINYRRFFDINDLAALAMEREDVFEAAHALVLGLVGDGKVDGLRIDHPDGLYDPATYFRRLQDHYLLSLAYRAFLAAPEFQGVDWKDVEPEFRARINAPNAVMAQNGLNPALYVVIEKILGSREPLVDTWPVHGTSGYDFVNYVGGLFVDASRAQAVSRLYHEFVQDSTRFSDLVYAKKLLIMQVSLASELHMLTHQLDRLAQKTRRSRDFTFNTLRYALREVIACFPVYRSYIDAAGASPSDRRTVEAAVRRARIRNPAVSNRVFRFVHDMLLGDSPESLGEDDRAEQQRFSGKFQQVTSPVMAKGLEDTAFYVYNRLVSLNEVGGDPDRFGVRPEALHAYHQERRSKWPFALSPLSTHDTKRSEDVRARISVLSEIPGEWRAAVERWSRMNVPHRRQLEDGLAPDANEEYLLYQTLVGAWPLEPCSAEETAHLIPRIQAYMEKALREAKVHSSWINPDPDYDKAVQEFVRLILDEAQSGPFLEDFRAFQRRISHLGLFNSLSQTLLKLASPGVPDTYQGTEVWDFSLVDPDNRRPVDYPKRAEMLGQLREAVAASNGDMCSLCRELVSAKENGRVKLYVHYMTLGLRRDQPGLLSAGDYIPAACTGTYADHVFAFVRRLGDTSVLVAVPRLMTSLIPESTQAPLGESVWGDTRLLLPSDANRSAWRNLFTGERASAAEHDGQRSLPAAQVFGHFPIALLMGVPEK
jgi:(1->4)-alpha-D-glucan 1-alpha-D-glucosylmutase